MLAQVMIEHAACGEQIDEGASSRVYECVGHPHLIIKQQRRQARAISHPPVIQQKIQAWAANAMTTDNFTFLHVPWSQAVGRSPRSTLYIMEKIDVSEPVDLINLVPEEISKDLIRFYFLCACSGFYPYDYEIYKQPDGKYYMVDFDKFGLIKDTFIEFPFKRTITLEEAACWAPPALSKIKPSDVDVKSMTKDLIGKRGLPSIPETPPFHDDELADLEIALRHASYELADKKGVENIHARLRGQPKLQKAHK